MKGPGAELFRAAQEELGELPFVAENLGVITPEVEAIRHEFGFPGMSMLQFAFGTDPQASDVPAAQLSARTGGVHGHARLRYDGGMVDQRGRGEARARRGYPAGAGFTRRYLNTDGREIHWAFIRALLASVADTVLIPLQDVLGLGSEARMNQPATMGGNWRWRYRAEMLTAEIAQRLAELTRTYER